MAPRLQYKPCFPHLRHNMWPDAYTRALNSRCLTVGASLPSLTSAVSPCSFNLVCFPRPSVPPDLPCVLLSPSQSVVFLFNYHSPMLNGCFFFWQMPQRRLPALPWVRPGSRLTHTTWTPASLQQKHDERPHFWMEELACMWLQMFSSNSVFL